MLESNIAGEKLTTPDNWLFCLRKGQSRTPKLPRFDWTGYVYCKIITLIMWFKNVVVTQRLFSSEFILGTRSINLTWISQVKLVKCNQSNMFDITSSGILSLRR